MSIFKSKVLQVFFVGLVLPFAMLSTSVQAEKYPNGPVTMVVPWTVSYTHLTLPTKA